MIEKMKKLLLFLGVVVSLPAFGLGQGYFVSKIALSARGIPAAGATVTVCTSGATLIPTNVTLAPGCSPTVSIFQDLALTVPQSNPFQADGLGNVGFYVAPGNYTYAITGPTVTPTLFVVTVPVVVGTSGLLSGSGTTNDITKWTGTFVLGNSSATDDGTNFTINDLFTNVNTLNAKTINTSTVNSSGSGANQLISGGGIFCSGVGLTCTVAATTVSIGGQTYSAPQTNVTLATADPTNPRIDVFEIDTTSTIGKITGTPAVNPVEPSIDPTTQWSLGFINVTAGETNIPVNTVTLYDENTGPPGEWTCAAGTGWNCADITAPFSGTKDIQGLGTVANAAVTLTNTSAISLASFGVLKMQLRTQSAWTGQNEVWLTWYNGSTPVGSTVFTSASAFGFNGGTAGVYQMVVPISSFGLGSNTVNSLQIKWNTGGAQPTNKTIYLDSIQMQSNGIGGTGGQAGTVSSVGMTGDGVVFNSTSGACGGPITSSGTFNLANCLGNAQAGFFLRGPIGSQRSNVAFRQSFTCVSGGTTATCSATNVISGDPLVIIPMPVAPGEFFFTATSDTLGTTWTQYGGSGGTHRAVGFLASSGNDTITISGGTVASGTPFLIMELTGVSTYNDTNSAFAIVSNGGGVPFTVSNTVTPLAATDSYINVVASNGTCYGGFQISPVSSPIVTWAPGGGQSTGAGWINAPGNISSITYSGTSSTRTGSCQNDFVLFTMDFSQSVAASSAPWVAGPITESDLPPTAINAIQSVQSFNIAATVPLPSNTNTTVISKSISMPSQGCPCRVLISYSGVEAVGGSGTVTSWVTDGTNSYATMQANTTDATAMPITTSDISAAYSNNQSVTFTWKVNPGTYATGTYQMNTGFAASTSTQNGHMTLTIAQSRN